MTTSDVGAPTESDAGWSGLVDQFKRMFPEYVSVPNEVIIEMVRRARGRGYEAERMLRRFLDLR